MGNFKVHLGILFVLEYTNLNYAKKKKYEVALYHTAMTHMIKLKEI